MEKRGGAGEELLRIGELARRTGASVDTLRHYERMGLLLPRRLSNGYRVYRPDAVERVRMIRAALALGFHLDELSKFLALRASGRPPCREVRALAASKLAELNALIERLTALRDQLDLIINDWDRRLESNNGAAHLLEALAGAGLAANPAGQRAPHQLKFKHRKEGREE